MRQNFSSVAAAPQIIPQTSSASQETTLTVIETLSRRVVLVKRVSNRNEALATFRQHGNGYDAHIRTPKYSELILSWRHGVQA